MALKALVWFLLLGAATIATAISNVIPNVTSHITSSLVDKKSQHAVCSFHATYIQRCQNEGKGWHMMTYVNIPYIMDGNRKPFVFPSDGNMHLGEQHISIWDKDLKLTFIDRNAPGWDSFDYDTGAFHYQMYDCKWREKLDGWADNGICGWCKTGDWTSPPLNCGKAKIPIFREHDSDCSFWC